LGRGNVPSEAKVKTIYLSLLTENQRKEAEAAAARRKEEEQKEADRKRQAQLLADLEVERERVRQLEQQLADLQKSGPATSSAEPTAIPRSSSKDRLPQHPIDPVPVDFTKVMFEPGKYRSKMLRSTVQLASVGYLTPEAPVLVVHRIGLGNELWIQCTKEIAEKALRLLQVEGEHGVIKITYQITDPSKMSPETLYRGVRIHDVSP